MIFGLLDPWTAAALLQSIPEKPMTDKELNDHLCANTASHVTVAEMMAHIAKVDHHHLPDSTVTICNITLDSGFSVRGESACVDPTRFDKTFGETYAYNNAFDKLWPFFGFLLAEKRHIRKRLAK